MSVDPTTLLRALGSGVRPVDAKAAASTSEAISFQQMLEDAAAGGVTSGLPVRVSRNAGVDLTPSQLARLSKAADRALFIIDGQVLEMDVGLRTITGKADLSATRVLNGVDAVVTVAPEAGDIPGEPPRLAFPLLNASLLKALGGRTPPNA